MSEYRGLKALIWKLNRLRTMGPQEVLYRIRQFGQALAESRGVGLARFPPHPTGTPGQPWTTDLPSQFGAHREEYIARGDRVLDGKFRVFALSEAELGFPPNWNRDPKTGVEAPLDFGKTMNYRNEAVVGDIKYLWEPNRHLELVALAQAWHLSGENRFLEGGKIFLDSWFDQSPYPLGVNWTSSLELAIRLINWSFAWHLFGGTSSGLFKEEEGERFRLRWLNSVYQHSNFIAGHFSRHSSANNHLLGEYAGLFVASITWPLWPQSAKWLETARTGLEKEGITQNAEDGGNREQAIWYHHEVADMLLLCGLIGRANGKPFSNAYWARLEAMLEFVASLMSVSGQLPMFGDSDDAVIVDLSIDRDVYHSLLATGAVLYQRGAFKAKSSGYDDRTRWLLGDAAEEHFNRIRDDQSNLPVHRAFPSSGYFILGDAFESPDEIRMIADAGALGYTSIAAHGHADALSVTLSVAGFEVLIDPGTYAYHTNPLWRDYFRGTAAHNTVRVDHLDQSVSGGNFMWLRHARAECLAFRTGKTEDTWTARHDGYARLADPVLHQRSIVFNKADRCFNVTDTLLCKAAHQIEIHWHCSERSVVSIRDNIVRIVVADVLVEIEMPGSSWRASLVEGQTQPPMGWVSRSFDIRVPSPAICFKGIIDGTTRLGTQVRVLRVEE